MLHKYYQKHCMYEITSITITHQLSEVELGSNTNSKMVSKLILAIILALIRYLGEFVYSDEVCILSKDINFFKVINGLILTSSYTTPVILIKDPSAVVYFLNASTR